MNGWVENEENRKSVQICNLREWRSERCLIDKCFVSTNSGELCEIEKPLVTAAIFFVIKRTILF